MREVASIFVSRNSQVLLSSEDGVTWYFPSIEMLPGETGQEAVKRGLCSAFDDSTEQEDSMEESPQVFRSHTGEKTNYHIFPCDPNLLRDEELRERTGVQYKWTDEPLLLKLSPCAQEMLTRYAFES